MLLLQRRRSLRTMTNDPALEQIADIGFAKV